MAHRLGEEWLASIKQKYKLEDDDVQEFIDSFNSINGGRIITPSILSKFIKQEISDIYTNEECIEYIKHINSSIGAPPVDFIDVKTFLCYMIPDCKDFVVNKVGTKQLFESLDKDGDGKIKSRDLISVLYSTNAGLTSHDLKEYEREIKKLCKKIDGNGDQHIDYAEFENFMKELGIE